MNLIFFNMSAEPSRKQLDALKKTTEGNPEVEARLNELDAETEARGDRGAFRDSLETTRKREVLRKNIEARKEAEAFWRQFFGDGMITSFLTGLSMLGSGTTPEDLNDTAFWEEVKKLDDELKEEGEDVEDRLVAHRVNFVSELRKKIDRGEKQVEFDVRAKKGEDGEVKLYLAHDPCTSPTIDQNFDIAMDFLAGHPDVKVFIDIKEMTAAKDIIARKGEIPGLNGSRCRLMSYNPRILTYLSGELTDVPLVFHYIPLSNAPVGVQTAVNFFGAVGVKRVADAFSGVYSEGLYTSNTTFPVGASREDLEGIENPEEMYCAWDTFPPDDLVEALKVGGREVWISIPYNLKPDGIEEWAKERGVELMFFGAETMKETGDALKAEASLVVSDATDKVDEHFGGEMDEGDPGYRESYDKEST